MCEKYFTLSLESWVRAFFFVKSALTTKGATGILIRDSLTLENLYCILKIFSVVQYRAPAV